MTYEVPFVDGPLDGTRRTFESMPAGTFEIIGAGGEYRLLLTTEVPVYLWAPAHECVEADFDTYTRPFRCRVCGRVWV